MAMVSGQTRGFTKSWQLNFGMACGMGAIGIVAGLFADWLQHTPTFIGGMKVVGSAYLLYLAYHVASVAQIPMILEVVPSLLACCSN